MLPSWHMVATDAHGLSRGVAALWNPKRILARAFQCFVGILLLEKNLGLSGSISVLNVYAPYKDRFPFWNKFLSSKILEIDSLLIGGNLIVPCLMMSYGEEGLSSTKHDWCTSTKYWLDMGKWQDQ